MMKPQVQIKRIIHKTKVFFHKTLQSLKSSLSGGYQKLSKPQHHRHQNPLYCSDNQNIQQLDQFYIEFTQHWDSGNHKPTARVKDFPRADIKEEDPCEFEKQNNHEENDMATSHEAKKPQLSNLIDKESGGGGGYVLAQKIKEMEMKDMNDGDHVLDIEEVLQYYSLIKSPVFIEIVDRFLMDMYSEFFLPLPQQSVTICNSSRRLRSLSISSCNNKMGHA